MRHIGVFARKAVYTIVLAALAVTLLPAGVLVERAQGASTIEVEVAATYDQAGARAMLSDVNKLRKEQAWITRHDGTRYQLGAQKAYVYDYALEQIAMQRAAEIAVSFSHTRPSGQDTWSVYSEFGVYAGSMGENIAVGYTSVSDVMTGWAEASEPYEPTASSPGQGHRRNLLGGVVEDASTRKVTSYGFTCIGMAHVRVGNIDYWVQEFGGYATNTTTPNATSTKEQQVAVTLDPSRITSCTLSKSSASLNLPLKSTAAIPSFEATIGFQDRWPSDVKLRLTLSGLAWRSANSSVAAVSGQKVQGRKQGQTKLKASFSTKSGSVSLSVDVEVSLWKRLSGGSALTTMKSIVNTGWSSSSWAIVATNKTYHDALSASGLAGILKAPVLMSDPKSLSGVTKNLLKNKKVKNVIVAGGTAAISKNVEKQIGALGIKVTRVAGGTAATTARAMYKEGLKHGSWGKDAVVATSDSFQDALSIAPYAYAKKAPIFLTDLKKKTLASAAVKQIKKGGFTRTLVVGGTAAVKSSVDKQVVKAKRLAGGTCYTTSKFVARFCLANGMTAAHMGVARGDAYQDALCGAALLGKNNSIIVLADDKKKNSDANIDKVIKANKSKLKKWCYVFGGESAISIEVWNKIVVAGGNK